MHATPGKNIDRIFARLVRDIISGLTMRLLVPYVSASRTLMSNSETRCRKEHGNPRPM
jgi:hypothetical protein